VFYVPPWALPSVCKQTQVGATIPHLTVGVGPTPRGQGKGDEDDVSGVIGEKKKKLCMPSPLRRRHCQ